MRGRGERLEVWPDASARMAGQRVLLLKPSFGISTAWAYGQLAANAPAAYLSEAAAEERLASWRNAPSAPLEALLFNTMEQPAFSKFPALPVLAARLRDRFNLDTHMSGSGSACFALLAEQDPVEPVFAAIRRAWGDSAFVTVARIRGGKV
jgi:4-diphosphocytidyl-2-C-methyl-D-erythritol kinase